MSDNIPFDSVTVFLSPLVVTIINSTINNKPLALIISVAIVFCAILIALYMKCQLITKGEMDGKQLLIDTSILCIVTFVFAFLYSISNYIPGGKIVASIAGLLIAMIVSYTVFKSYYLVATTDNCPVSKTA
jgi:hypothetical protein